MSFSCSEMLNAKSSKILKAHSTSSNGNFSVWEAYHYNFILN